MSGAPQGAESSGRDMPVSRALFAIDIEGASKLPEISRRHLPEAMYGVAKEAFHRVGIDWDQGVVDLSDDGDGFIASLDEVHTARLVDAVRPLDDLLRANRDNFRGPPMRMRVAIHHGQVPPGLTLGTPVIEVVRMLNSDDLRDVLAHTRSSVAVMVSDGVHRMVVLEGNAYTVESADFVPVNVHAKGMSIPAWVHTPARDVSPRLLYPQRRRDASIDLKPVTHEAFMERVAQNPNLAVFLPPKNIGAPLAGHARDGSSSGGGAVEETPPARSGTQVPWKQRPLEFGEPGPAAGTRPGAAVEPTRAEPTRAAPTRAAPTRAEPTRAVRPPPGRAPAPERGPALEREPGR